MLPPHPPTRGSRPSWPLGPLASLGAPPLLVTQLATVGSHLSPHSQQKALHLLKWDSTGSRATTEAGTTTRGSWNVPAGLSPAPPSARGGGASPSWTPGWLLPCRLHLRSSPLVGTLRSTPAARDYRGQLCSSAPSAQGTRLLPLPTPPGQLHDAAARLWAHSPLDTHLRPTYGGRGQARGTLQ